MHGGGVVARLIWRDHKQRINEGIATVSSQTILGRVVPSFSVVKPQVIRLRESRLLPQRPSGCSPSLSVNKRQGYKSLMPVSEPALEGRVGFGEQKPRELVSRMLGLLPHLVCGALLSGAASLDYCRPGNKNLIY